MTGNGIDLTQGTNKGSLFSAFADSALSLAQNTTNFITDSVNMADNYISTNYGVGNEPLMDTNNRPIANLLGLAKEKVGYTPSNAMSNIKEQFGLNTQNRADEIDKLDMNEYAKTYLKAGDATVNFLLGVGKTLYQNPIDAIKSAPELVAQSLPDIIAMSIGGSVVGAGKVAKEAKAINALLPFAEGSTKATLEATASSLSKKALALDIVGGTIAEYPTTIRRNAEDNAVFKGMSKEEASVADLADFEYKPVNMLLGTLSAATNYVDKQILINASHMVGKELKEIALASTKEMVQEGTQQALNSYSAREGDIDWNDVRENAAMGVVGGAGFHGVGKTFGATRDVIGGAIDFVSNTASNIKEKVNKLTQEKESNTEDTVSNEPVESFIEREKSSLLKDKIINPINDVVSSTVDSIKNTTSEALDSIESDFKTNIKSAIDSVANFNTFEQFNSAKESIINTAKTLKASILSNDNISDDKKVEAIKEINEHTNEKLDNGRVMGMFQNQKQSILEKLNEFRTSTDLNQNYSGRSSALSFLKEADKSKVNNIVSSISKLTESEMLPLVEGMITAGMFDETILSQIYDEVGISGLQVRRMKSGGLAVAASDEFINKSNSKLVGDYMNSLGSGRTAIGSSQIMSKIFGEINNSGSGKSKVEAIRNAMSSLGLKETGIESLGNIYEKFSYAKTKDELDAVRNELVSYFGISEKDSTESIIKKIEAKASELNITDKENITKLKKNIFTNIHSLGLKLQKTAPEAKITTKVENTNTYTENNSSSVIESPSVQESVYTQTSNRISASSLINKLIETKKSILTKVFTDKNGREKIKGNEHEINNAHDIFFDKLSKLSEFIYTAHMVKGIANGTYFKSYSIQNGKVFESLVELSGINQVGGKNGITVINNSDGNSGKVFIYESIKDLVANSNEKGLHISVNGANNFSKLQEIYTSLNLGFKAESVMFQLQNDSPYKDAISKLSESELKDTFFGKDKELKPIGVEAYINSDGTISRKPYTSVGYTKESLPFGYNEQNVQSLDKREKPLNSFGSLIYNLMSKSKDVITTHDMSSIRAIMNISDFESIKKDLLDGDTKSLLKILSSNFTKKQVEKISDVIKEIGINEVIEIVESTSYKEQVESFESKQKYALTQAGLSHEMSTLVLAMLRRRFGLDKNGKFSFDEFQSNIESNKVPTFVIGDKFEIDLKKNSKDYNRIELASSKIVKLITANNAFATKAVFHELAHSVQNSLSKKESDLFVKIFGDLSINNISVSESFAMAFSAYLTGSSGQITAQARTSRQKLITKALEVTGADKKTIRNMLIKIEGILKDMFDAIALKIKSLVSGKDLASRRKESQSLRERGEINTEFGRNIASNPIFTEYINTLFGVDSKVESFVASDNESVKSEIKKIKDVFNDVSKFNKNYSNKILSSMFIGSNKTGFFKETFNEALETVENYMSATYVNNLQDGLFNKIANIDIVKKATKAVVDTGITESEFVKKLKVDFATAGTMANSYYKKLDAILDESLNHSKRNPNEIAASYNVLFSEITKNMTDKESEYLTNVLGYTEINNLSSADFNEIMSGAIDIKYNIDLIESKLDSKTLDAVNSLAYFMRTGLNNSGDNLYTNTELITQAFGSKEDISKLVTLKALQSLDLTDIKRMYKDNPTDIIMAFGAIKELKNRLIEEHKSNKESNLYVFGDMRNPSNNSLELKSFDDAEYNLRMSKNEKWNILDKITDSSGKNTYIATRKDLNAKMTSGVIANVSAGFRGETIKHSFNGEYAIPVRDENGKITGYKLSIGKENSKKHEDMIENIVDVMKSYSVYAEKYLVRKSINEKIRNTLTADLFAEDLDLSPENSPIFLSVDKKILEAINFKLPTNQREKEKVLIDFITTQFGADVAKEYKLVSNKVFMPKELSDVMLVKKGYSDIMYGYHEFMLLGGENRALRMAEILLKEFVVLFKQNVVFKSMPTIANNLMFNIGLMFGNIPADRHFVKNATLMYSEVKKAGSEIRLYGMKVRRTMYLEIKEKSLMEVGKTLSSQEKSELDRISKDVKDNYLHYFYENGFIQSIADDVLDNDISSSNIGNASRIIQDKAVDGINSRLGTNINKRTVKRVTSELYMSPDSKIGKELSNFMKNTDYVFRIAMYNYLVKTGTSDTEAKQISLESFVDYRKALPFELQTISEYGVVPFIGWIVRMQSALGKTAKRNPIMTILSMLASFSGFSDSMAGIKTSTWNPTNSFGLNAIGGANPFNAPILDLNTIVPVLHEDIYNGVFIDNEKLSRVFGFTIVK